MKKTIIAFASFIILIVIGLGIVAFNPNNVAVITPESPVPVSEIENNESEDVTLIIQYNDEDTSTYSVSYAENTTAFSILEDISLNEGFEFTYDEYDFGNLVTSISGYENSDEMAWIYFVNGNAGDVAADQKLLEPGDSVEWKYIEPIY